MSKAQEHELTHPQLVPQLQALTKSTEGIKNFNSSVLRSIITLRCLGYGLLMLVLFDWIEMFVPGNFLNANWEFETFGAIIERVPVLLIGLTLVFLGELDGRSFWEILILRFLSWLSVIGGVLFFLLVPIAIGNTIRLDEQNNKQITTEVKQQKTLIQEIKTQLNNATTKTQVEQLFSHLNVYRAPEIQTSQRLEDAKQELSTILNRTEISVNRQAVETRSKQFTNLLKKSIKWSLGALVSGCLLICIWRLTGWTRQRF